MTELIPPSLQEVWDWKERADRETVKLSREELIAFYRREADEAQRRLGIKLNARPASEPTPAPKKQER